VKCDAIVRADSPETIAIEAAGWPAGERVLVLAPIARPAALPWDEQAGHLLRAGYTRILLGDDVVPLEPLPKLGRAVRELRLVVDRFSWQPEETQRLSDSCAQAFRRGEGRLELRCVEASFERRSERW
jgi:excinuclease UvrABC ATPase subunit